MCVLGHAVITKLGLGGWIVYIRSFTHLEWISHHLLSRPLGSECVCIWRTTFATQWSPKVCRPGKAFRGKASAPDLLVHVQPGHGLSEKLRFGAARLCLKQLHPGISSRAAGRVQSLTPIRPNVLEDLTRSAKPSVDPIEQVWAKATLTRYQMLDVASRSPRQCGIFCTWF